MDISTAIKHAIDGNAMLFTGSGFSFGAVPLEGKKFLTGRELAKRLYEECGIAPPDDDLYYASKRYLKANQPKDLVLLLEKLFTVREVGDLHKRFSEIRWKSVFTTNYDDVLETAFKAKGKKLHPITIDKDTNTFTSRNNCCVHINGFIGELSPDALKCSFKLTNTSYLTEEFSKSNWSFIFRRALETSKAIVFIGYSMYDLDIGRILYADSALRDKTIFIERDDASDDYLENSIQNEFGTIAPVGLHGFWKEYDEVVKYHTPVDRHQTVLDFSEVKISETAAPMRDDDAFDFLLKGEINIDLIWNGAIDNGLDSPFIRREEHRTVVDQIKRGEQLVVVTSDMANGKSVFAMGLRAL